MSVDKILRQIFIDPGTTKFVTSVCSGTLIGILINAKPTWNLIPIFVILGTSLLYSVSTFLIIVFKQQETITNADAFNNLFGVHFSEFVSLQQCCPFSK